MGKEGSSFFLLSQSFSLGECSVLIQREDDDEVRSERKRLFSIYLLACHGPHEAKEEGKAEQESDSGRINDPGGLLLPSFSYALLGSSHTSAFLNCSVALSFPLLEYLAQNPTYSTTTCSFLRFWAFQAGPIR